jgi:hypothetical protein
MGFLKRLIGGNEPKKPAPKPGPGGYVDTQGIYLYVQCDNCGTPVRVRADKQYDLTKEGGSYSWHKTIVDNRCFRQMPAVVVFNAAYEVTDAQITGGRFITEAEYDAYYAARQAEKAAAAAAQTPDETPPAS